jgi:hypothetical protein
MTNPVIRTAIIVLAVVGALALVVALVMLVGCGSMGCGGMMQGMMSGMMDGR